MSCTTERRTATVGRLLVVIVEGANLSTGGDGRFTRLLCFDSVSCSVHGNEAVKRMFAF